jgi:hypothetical protein
MPPKAPRPQEQIDKLALTLSRRWIKADGIEPWLRRNVTFLTGQQRDKGWSWNDIGRAMTLAGITYGSGRVWTGHLLATKISQTRAQIAARGASRPTRKPSVPFVAPEGSPISDALPAPPQRFAPASLRGHTPAPPPVDKAEPPQAPARQDPDEVIARLLGKPRANKPQPE